MPPVFGPSSPSKARLKSCAGTSGIALTPSQIAKSETSGPSSNSSTMKLPPRAVTALRASSSSASDLQTNTPFPAARPSAFTTHGGRATASWAAVATPAAASTSLANALEPSIAAAAALGPKTAIPAGRRTSATPPTSGASGPITTRSMSSAWARASSPSGVLGPNRMALGQTRDARAPRRGMEIGQRRGLRELPGERVLAPARTDQESTHRASIGVGFRMWITPTFSGGSTPTSRPGEPTTRKRSAGSSRKTPATATTRDEGDDVVEGRAAIVASWLEDRDEPGSLDGRVPPVGDRRRARSGRRCLALPRRGRLDGRARVPQRLPLPLRRRRPLLRVHRVLHAARRRRRAFSRARARAPGRHPSRRA